MESPAFAESLKKKILTDNRALFGSRNGNRISVTAVHRLVDKALLQAGLDSTQFSAHKLRHTAATLMYQHGNVDLRVLQNILGHESLGTTEIYTHLSNEQLERAVSSNPLAQVEMKKVGKRKVIDESE